MKTDELLYAGSLGVQRMEASPIRVILDRAAALRAAGHTVISFSAGEPDFSTPEPIKRAAIRALEQNYTHYGSNRGNPALRRLLAEHFARRQGVAYDPETEVLITCGGAEAINNALLAVLDPGDEVLLPSPAFVSYKNLARFAGATVVDIPLPPERGFQPDPAEIERRITDRTKLLILNNPNNPTGAVYGRDTLAALADIAVRRHLLVFSDEMYSSLVYGDAVFTSMAAFPGMKERTILVNGFSKTYAMTGWRIGYLMADARLVGAILRVHQYSTTCSPTFIQQGLAESLCLPQTRAAVQGMHRMLAGRRKAMLAGLNGIARLACIPTDGAFYVMVDVSATGLDGQTFATRLLEEKDVATVPAIGLGAHCGNFIRISYAASDADIAEGLRRIAAFTDSL